MTTMTTDAFPQSRVTLVTMGHFYSGSDGHSVSPIVSTVCRCQRYHWWRKA